MALVKAESAVGFQRLPVLRQLGLMIGLAASVALGVAVVLWSQTPSYTLLYGNLSASDAGQVIDALHKSNITFKVDEASGAILVPGARLHEARMELAKEGLPQGNSVGFELLEKEQGFGTSQFVEKARYQRALEGELARTIGALRNVKAARVHLAIPKRSVFLRDRSAPTASVMVDLYAGRTLDEAQVAAIVHLVSSSVPYLEPAGVTIVDQRGQLLSNGSSDPAVAPGSTQFAYNRKLEQNYSERIRQLLEPIVGHGKVRASVNASLDFTVTERTQESYNPDLPALRSEQISEDETASSASSNSTVTEAGGGAAAGVPGALSNQPPETGGVAGGGQGSAESGEGKNLRNRSKRSVRNYELDKTITHTRLASGAIRRLAIAVLVDDKQEIGDDGEPVAKPWSDEDLARFTRLVKEAVGFDARRGDTLNVINTSFAPPPEIEPLPEPSLLEQPWVWDAAKQAGGVIGLLLLVFGVLKPVLRSLAEKGAEPAAGMVPAGAAAGAGQAGVSEDQLSLSGASPQQAQLEGPKGGYQQHLETAQSVVKEDPKRVAQVVKNWVGEDG